MNISRFSDIIYQIFPNMPNFDLLDPFLNIQSVQFSCSVTSDSLWPHELQHARPPCPSTTPGVHPNSCPSSGWCHPAISSSVVPFSSCPQSLPASESFPMSQLFTFGGGQSIGVSTLASVLPKNTEDWSPSEWIGWIPQYFFLIPTPGFLNIKSRHNWHLHLIYSRWPCLQTSRRHPSSGLGPDTGVFAWRLNPE